MINAGSSYTNLNDIMFMTMDIETAVDSALDNMPDDSELKKLLIANKAEVKQMCITEYNEAETMEQFKDEGRAEGRVEGRIEGRAETIFSCVYENDFTAQHGTQKLNLSIEQFREKYNYWLKMKKN